MPNPGVYFSEIQPVGFLAPFSSVPKGDLFQPHSLSGSLTGWSQTPCLTLSEPQELAQQPSLFWGWSNIKSLQWAMSVDFGREMSFLLLSLHGPLPSFPSPVS